MTKAAPAIAPPPPARPSNGVKVITVKMSAEYLAKLEALEQRLGCNQSEIVRMAVDRLHERMVT